MENSIDVTWRAFGEHVDELRELIAQLNQIWLRRTIKRMYNPTEKPLEEKLYR